MLINLVDCYCFTCGGNGSLTFGVPYGVRFSKYLAEVQDMEPYENCDIGERESRFHPQRNGWPQLPDGLNYSHLCHEPRCGNPRHFVVTTHSINHAMEANPHETKD